MKNTLKSLLATGLMVFFGTSCASAPCDGVDRDLPQDLRGKLTPIVSKQLQAPAAEILQSFRFDTWQIIFVETGISDPGFFFYSGDPASNKFITTWGGAAGANEQRSILQWTKKNAVGIPDRLAQCFAWYVTHDNNQK